MKANHFLIIACLTGITAVGSAQDNPETTDEQPKKEKKEREFKRHEVNLGFGNLFNRTNNNMWLYWAVYDDYWYGDYWYYPYMPSSINDQLFPQFGAGYKYRFKKGAIRVYVDFGSRDQVTKNSVSSSSATTDYEYTLRSNSYGGRIGYEYTIGNNKTLFYFGADLITKFSDYNWEQETVTTYTGVSAGLPTTWSKFETELQANSFGAGPFLGLKYRLTDMISVSTETRFDFTGFTEKGENKSSSDSQPASTGSDFSTNGTKVIVSPLGLFSLNVHF